MVVELLDIEVWNFFAIRYAKVEYHNKGFVVVRGSNGSGKTTMFIEAPRYLCYGTSYEYGAQPGDKVVRRHASFMKIEGRIKVGETVWTITRQRGKHSSVSIKENGVDVSPGVDVQERIDSILGISERVFLNTTVFSTSLVRFPSYSDLEKKRIFDEILEMKAFDDALERAKALSKIAKANLSEVVIRCESVSRDISWAQSDVSRLQKEILAIESTSGDSESLKTMSDEQVSVQEKRAEMERKVNKADNDVSAGEKVLNSQTSEIKSKLAAVDAQLHSIEQTFKHQRTLIEAGKCPKCGQDTSDLPEDADGTLKGKKASLLAERAALSGRLAVVQERMSQFTNLRERIRTGRHNIQEMSQKINKLTSLINAVKSSGDKVSAAKAKLEAATDRIQRLSGELEELNTRKSASSKEVSDCETLEDCFGPRGARLGKYEHVLPFLNSEAARVSDMMSTSIEAKFSINAETQSNAGKLIVSADNSLGAGQYMGNSAGEKRRIDLICLFALLSLSIARSSVIFGQAFFDEAFEKMDDEAQEDFVKIIKTLLTEKNSVFIISHVSHRLEAQADAVIDMQSIRAESDKTPDKP